MARNEGIEWIIDDRQAQDACKLMVRNVKDFRRYWEPIIDAILADNKQRFDSNDGGSWKPDTARYMKWKVRHGHGIKLLHLTGTLYKALTEKGDYGQKVTRGREALTIRFYGSAHHGTRTNTAAEQAKRGRKVVNPDSPYLRRAMGKAAGEIALQWKREWEMTR